MPDNFWVLFVINLPLLVALFVALQRKWIVMGVTFDREMTDKDEEIDFREKLRQEAIADRDALRLQDQEKTLALKELTDVVKQSLELNDRLLGENLSQRWDGNDRRASKTSTRTR